MKQSWHAITAVRLCLYRQECDCPHCEVVAHCSRSDAATKDCDEFNCPNVAIKKLMAESEG